MSCGRRLWLLCIGATLLGITVHYVCALYLIGPVLPLRRPVQDWLTSIGLGAIAPYYAFVNLRLPWAACALGAGALLGRLAPRHWSGPVLCYLVGTHMPALIEYGLFPTNYLLHILRYDLPIVMPALVGGAWLVSRRRRRFEDRRAAHLCMACGYDLRGSSTVCPECGRPTTASE